MIGNWGRAIEKKLFFYFPKKSFLLYQTSGQEREGNFVDNNCLKCFFVVSDYSKLEHMMSEDIKRQ